MSAQANARSLASCNCLPNFVNTDPEHPAACECGPGFGFDARQGVCGPCPKGTYKLDAGNSLCSSCPEDQSTLQTASNSADDCLCLPGFRLSNDGCDDCPPGAYCNGTGVAFPCPEGATSVQGARSVEECLCEPGYFQEGSLCRLCPGGSYKPNKGNEPSCPLQCPTSSTSKNGSATRTDCYCLTGFYAELESEFLSRCVSCETLSALHCPGGFQQNGSLHQLPVAMPGYFQTGIITAFKCNVFLDENLSTCLGGGVCGGGPVEKTCVGNYSNACADGSLGFLCGECLAGWARTGFQKPCQQCQDSTLPLVGSIFVDVGSKAIMSFVVASLAATAAVKGSSKLHTIMIRITSHWLAACSVITAFDLSQVPLVFEDGEEHQQSQVQANFAWPPEITDAMRRFFDELSLTPTLVSIEFSTQCRAQDMFPESPAAARVALGLYYLFLPLLVTVAIVGLSWLAVHGLVPLAARCGYFFNEADKRHRATMKWHQKLRDAAEDILEQAGLSSPSWADIQQSGAANLTLAQLQEAAAHPDAFLCQALIASPALILDACTARARSQSLPVDKQALLQMDLRFRQSEIATQAAHKPKV